ncbi:MAG: sigma-70 region 4 domain-containing protein [Kiritimatiellaeota bacterium]|nr:sigma-70 region 4 domain-containing protein [Kiritimatiellota bacterium]
MECHRCPHREDVESGKYRGVAFVKTPCASCEQVEKSGYTIAFDEERADKEIVDGGGGTQVTGMENDIRLPISVMSEAVAQLLTMPPAVRDVVCWRFAGMKYGDIARVQGVTVAAVENRQRRAMQRWPALRALFAEKAAKQGRRKPHGVRK